MPRNRAWFRCVSEKYGVRMQGLLTIEFEDAVKAREALLKMVDAVGRAIEAEECELRKHEG